MHEVVNMSEKTNESTGEVAPPASVSQVDPRTGARYAEIRETAARCTSLGELMSAYGFSSAAGPATRKRFRNIIGPEETKRLMNNKLTSRKYRIAG